MPTFWSVSCFCAMTTGMVTAAEQADAGAKARVVAGPVCETGPSALLPALVTEEGMMEPPAPLPPNVEVRRVVVTAGAEDAVIAGPSAGVPPPPCEDNPAAVYCNTLGQWAFGVIGINPDLILGDDIATTAVAGCILDRYVIKVTGDVYGDGTGVGPYDVHVALYDACPNAGGTEIRGTAKDVTIPDNRTTTIEVPIAYDIPLPASLYVGVRFSRVTAGTVMGAPATVGFSADSFDSPHVPCRGWYGGFPANPHGSFYAEIYVRPDCPSAFVGYKNSNHARSGFSPGGSILFADDITLGVQECDMVAYEVAVEGTGRTDFHLRRLLTEETIPGTDGWTWTSVLEGPVIKRVEFDEPISLPQSLYIVFETSHYDVGPIITGRQAGVGSSEDLYWIYDGMQWIPHSETVYSAFDVSIWCAGLPPTGACCDMILPSTCLGGDNDGDPCLTDAYCRGWPCVGEVVCREVPEMNCPYPDLWEEGAMCESACEGGENEGQPCTRQADCPGGDCPGPFAHPCGVFACCKSDDTCEDLTEKQCFELEPVEYDPQRYQPGSFCGEGGQRCPRYACRRRVGDCTLVRPEPGCEDPFCCDQVCDFDPWCCHVAWDELCVRWSKVFCPDHLPSNDMCQQVGGHGGALLVAVPSVTGSNSIHERSPPPDQPDFCCNVDGQECLNPDGDCVVGTVWYKFVATDTSALLSTCCSAPLPDAPADDSLVQVFSVGVDDPDVGVCDDRSTCIISQQNCGDGSTCQMDDHRACDKLNPIACNDDAGDTCSCQDNPEPTRSKLCVTGLIPNHTYYVMVAGAVRWESVPGEDKQWVEHRGRYELDITSPCVPSVPPLHNDICENAEPITGDDIVVPFALATGFCNDGTPCTLPGPDCADGSDCVGQSFATFDCPHVCLHNPETMQNDVWYDWMPLSSGEATIETCGEDDDSTPNTTMVVYDGCDCPAESWLDCEDYSGYPGCLSGSRVTIDVTKGNCYKIRLGGWAGDNAPCGYPPEPCIGNLSVNVVRFDDCNWNGIPDECDIDCGAPGGPCYVPDCGQSEDCDGDGVPDNEEGCEWTEGGDMDGDGDVDLSDYELFSACMTDPCGSPPCAPLYADDCCAYADLDDDGDVDLGDFAAFQAAFTGP